jgi:hypothetical protein
MCGGVRRSNRRQIGVICTQPSGKIRNGAAKQNGVYSAGEIPPECTGAGCCTRRRRALMASFTLEAQIEADGFFEAHQLAWMASPPSASQS